MTAAKKTTAVSEAPAQTPMPTPGLTILSDDDVKRFVEVVNTFGQFDTDVMVNNATMASRYMRSRVIIEEFLNRVLQGGSEYKVTVGLFHDKDMPARKAMGYILLDAKEHFKNWSKDIEIYLGVYLEDGRYVKIGNKYVCFILKQLREKWMQKWLEASNALGLRAAENAGVNKPVEQAEPGEFASQTEFTTEPIYRKPPQTNEE